MLQGDPGPSLPHEILEAPSMFSINHAVRQQVGTGPTCGRRQQPLGFMGRKPGLIEKITTGGHIDMFPEPRCFLFLRQSDASGRRK
jgi:hypothetical protein